MGIFSSFLAARLSSPFSAIVPPRPATRALAIAHHPMVVTNVNVIIFRRITYGFFT